MRVCECRSQIYVAHTKYIHTYIHTHMLTIPTYVTTTLPPASATVTAGCADSRFPATCTTGWRVNNKTDGGPTDTEKVLDRSGGRFPAENERE